MPVQPLEITLDITPRSRLDVIDVSRRIRDLYGDLLSDYSKLTCCSFHTTAGYPEQRLCERLHYSKKRIDQFICSFQKMFPPDAGYLHDCMNLRRDLEDSEKEREPANADSHLTFISAGLKNCVTYVNSSALPIYFVDLDGVHKWGPRNRQTTVLAYDKEQIVYRGRFLVPVAGEPPIGSLNLKDPRYRLMSHLRNLLNIYRIEKGLIRIALAQEERHSALTVNEYETLLMRSDLPEAMSNPLRYILRRTKKLLQNPTSIPGKTRSYAVYDLIHLYNELMKSRQVGRAVINRTLSRLSGPMSRIFRLERHVDLLVSTSMENRHSGIVLGAHQSPILLQHERPDTDVRCLEITLRRFE